MSQLTKGMYGSEFSPELNQPFGLRCGQMRPMKGLIGNAGWYNRAGEKLGFGDIGSRDLQTIANELAPNEVFAIVPEQDSYWAFVYPKKGFDLQEEAPGPDYVAQHAVYIVMQNEVLYISASRPDGEVFESNGVKIRCINRDMARVLLLGFLPKQESALRDLWKRISEIFT